jgi:branched-chain amino acid transport system permease protein
MATFFQQIINGIAQGSAYALIALGYTMVYGVLRLINFAHSDVFMFGAYMGYYTANNAWVRSTFGESLTAAIIVMLVAMALAAVLGILIERFAYRPGRSETRWTLAFWLELWAPAQGKCCIPECWD